MKRALIASVLAGLVLASAPACGDEEGSGTSTTTTTTATSGTAGEVTTSTDGSVTEETAADGLPGEPADTAPAAGSSLAVIGVAHDDVLHLRATPSPDGTEVGSLTPTGTATALGRARRVPSGTWYEVESPEGPAWANAHYLAATGTTSDITSQVVSLSAGTNPAAPTMEALGEQVAGAMLGEVAEGEPRVVMVAAPTVGDLGEVTFDAIGYTDDSLLGQRLLVLGTPDGSGFTLKSVEATDLCARAAVDGTCT